VSIYHKRFTFNTLHSIVSNVIFFNTGTLLFFGIAETGVCDTVQQGVKKAKKTSHPALQERSEMYKRISLFIRLRMV
jgi:hypothetical protein